MKKIHIIYPEDNKTMISFVKLELDNQEFVLKKRVPQVIEVEGDAHQLIVKGNTFSNADISLSDGELKASASVDEKIWCDISVNLVEDDEYFIFKTPFFLNGKGKLKKVSKDKFESKCK